MASVANDPRGFRRVLFIGLDGKRWTIRLGKVAEKIADAVARHVENILVRRRCIRRCQGKRPTWLADQPDKFYAKLVKAGLVNPRQKSAEAAATLGPFLDQYVARRSDIRPATKLVIGHMWSAI